MSITGISTPRMGTPAQSRRHRRLSVVGVVAALLMLACAPAALADSTESSNWAGYAAHGSGRRFRKVIGTWRQPTAVCSHGTPTYSSVWVGLGGYSIASQALEQIGSEVDCSATGKVVSSAWYEMVPAASRTIRMTIDPGDRLSASVVVNGHQVDLELRDLTRRTTFSRSVRAELIDVSSAEWIVEAPSECTGANSCQTLALANFGTASFTSARAGTVGGHTGSIVDGRWRTTKIVLATGQRRFIGSSSGALAAPSSLSDRGSAFSVTYKTRSGATAAHAARRSARVSAAVRALSRARVHPGGTRVR